MRPLAVILVMLLEIACFALPSSGEEPLRVATFKVDASPPIGSPVAYALTRKVVDPLSARGIVLLGQEKPIVLCAVDWIGIGNRGQDVWRDALAQAAGTTRDRVALHTVHQHDGPRCDFDTAALLQARDLEADFFDIPFTHKTIDRCARAIQNAVGHAQPVTHLGIGKAKVSRVASNRRILGSDGKVRLTRWSRCTDPNTIAAPEGLVDPWVRLLSFWNGDQALAVLTYYATHPMSHYGQGDVSADFVGLARSLCEKTNPGPTYIHFNGAGGNITAGKYNDGSEQRRPILTQRLASGIQRAWQSTVRTPIQASDVTWRVKYVRLPLSQHLDEQDLLARLDDTHTEAKQRLGAASRLAWLQRHNRAHPTEISCLHLAGASVLHLPGELFVEYQIAAQAMSPQRMVCMAAYGDYGPGYIGTDSAYSQGGYETSPRASLVAPPVEDLLMSAMEELLVLP